MLHINDSIGYYTHDEAIMRAAKLLCKRQDIEKIEYSHPYFYEYDISHFIYDTWEHEISPYADVKITFSDRSTYSAVLKYGWEGPIREAIGLELAKVLGSPMYDAVAGSNFLLVEKIEGYGLKLTDSAEYAYLIAKTLPLLIITGYSDVRPHHFIYDTDSMDLKVIDWGRSLIYRPLPGVNLMLLAAEHLNSLEFNKGIAEGRKEILEHYTRNGTKARIEELLEPMNNESYTDIFVGGFLKRYRSGAYLVKTILDNMDKVALQWEMLSRSLLEARV
jgi:hypothetical protein